MYCLMSVTSIKMGSFIHPLLFLCDDFALDPGFFIQWEKLDVRSMLAQPLFDFQKQLALVRRRQFAKKGAELDALKAVIQAGIGDLHARAIARDMIDAQITHGTTRQP